MYLPSTFDRRISCDASKDGGRCKVGSADRCLEKGRLRGNAPYCDSCNTVVVLVKLVPRLVGASMMKL